MSMKKSEFESTYKTTKDRVSSWVSENPIYGVLIALLAGYLVAFTSRMMLPLLFILGCGVACLYFLADDDDSQGTRSAGADGSDMANTSEDEGGTKTNGSKADQKTAKQADENPRKKPVQRKASDKKPSASVEAPKG